MRGKKRDFAGYHASRGWFDTGVRRVVRKWIPKLAETNAEKKLAAIRSQLKPCEPLQRSVLETVERQSRDRAEDTIEQLFFRLARRFEQQGELTLQIRYGNDARRYFIYDLLRALDDLHHPNNAAGWVIKMCGRPGPNPIEHKTIFEYPEKVRPQTTILGRSPQPLTFKEMAEEIRTCGGPKFEPATLEKAAQRLRIAGGKRQE